MAATHEKREAAFGSKARNPQRHKPAPELIHRWPEDLNWFIGIPGGLAIGLSSIFLPPLVGLAWTAVGLAGAFLVLLLVVLRNPKRFVRGGLAIVLALLVATSAVVWLVTRPTHEQQETDRLVGAIREADGWISPPLFLPRSRQHIINSFPAFDPDRPHAWTELGGSAEHAPLADLVQSATAFEGRTAVTVGRIVHGQDVGGQLLVQLTPLEEVDTKRLAKDSALADLVPDHYSRSQLLASPVSSSSGSHLVLMCLITPRAFVNQSAGYYWVVKGTVLAVGRLARTDGTLNQTAYMVCSSGERISRS